MSEATNASPSLVSSELQSSLWSLAAFFSILTLGGVLSILGGMKLFVLVLAVCLAVVVFQRPKEAIWAGIIYILACQVIFPSAARFDVLGDTPIWEMYYWATGLLIVTLAAILRLGPRKLLRIPTSAKAFFLAATAAAVAGFVKGNTPSHIASQFFGSLLLVLYFAIGLLVADERLFLRRMRTFGLLCAAGFFVYYAAVFSEYGLHKEMTSIGTLEGVIAILCVVTGLVEKRLSWIASGMVLFCVPLILFWRHMILAFVFGIVLALAMKTSVRKWKVLFYATAFLVALPTVLPEGAGIVLEKLMGIPAIERILPEGTRDVSSLADRTIELVGSVETLQAHPVFGDGIGSEFAWDRAWGEKNIQAYIDNGWAFVAIKMGGVGLLAFGWFLFTILRGISKNSLAISVAFLTFVIVILFSEEALFQFTTSPMAGVLAGLLVARGRSSSSVSTTSGIVELAHV
jgi:hypothetical protein